ncbi:MULTISPECIES: sensor histidine kinase [unclassified Tolypothrix]|uniref:sensor histidine kinase n=1 Tax=unclassified Tolypothrix TaxID=2649714 RepID=UPI0005EAC567|nr:MULTISPECIES: CHASE2 domain-containing protein [unclassified Tolypothrix]BAY91288.1 putative Chase2 sensor protein [Microchaete diplosiphon NIES-3275]EKF04184.1 sensor histidine kinase [Tolypothrix sp. PCC 7601]MBE9084456.1 CHASE2 domain-containing protein [Tolypothrix sp. LEGE 11397]UYD25357.1 CHASE2 domain-containing protein [Tolypothrix sp. PCC 7712]UYD32398.1 CHASE2 domain-containing protein [Tolypothrix sp. PCC 7601]
MERRIWNRIRQELGLWTQAAPPGIMVLVVVILIRIAGGMQPLEWMLLDTMLRLRPVEKLDERVVIVGIDEQDIQSVGQYPVTDEKIAQLLTKLETYQPLAIGLDIFKNVPVEPGGEQLKQVLQKNNNIIGIEKILPPDTISPPPSLPPQQVGFVDLRNDEDSKNRRYLLYTSNPQNIKEGKSSLALLLITKYFQNNRIKIDTGINDPNTIRFNGIELPRITNNFGGYVNVDDAPLSILMNFRNNSQPFHVVSLLDILNEKVDGKLLRDRIVLVGNRNMSAGDFFYTSAVRQLGLKGVIYGIDYHAHVISQILSSVIDSRPMLHSWGDIGEYAWIFIWGFLPIVIGRLTQSVWRNILSVGVAGFCLFSCGYVMLWVWGLWIPVAPNLLILALNGLGLSAFAFYQHDQFLRSQINERQNTIQHTFTIIHNGPLQTLAYGLQHLRAQDIPYEQLVEQFEKLNLEIREIGEFLKLEALTKEESLRLGSGLILELNRPLHDLLYEVYSSTLERQDFENFKTLKVKIRNFDPIDEKYLNQEDKRGICLFLEEALCNVGKHAKGVKRVQASGVYSENKYNLSVKDNGSGFKSKLENKGTKHSKILAKQLGGEFRRESLSPRGTICELSWTPIKKFKI